MQKGGGTLMVSPKLRELVREAKLGYTSAEVMELTGLAKGTWENMLRGVVVGPSYYRQLAVGLDLDPEIFLAEVRVCKPQYDPFESLQFVCSREIGLTATATREVLRLARGLARAGEEDGQQAA